MEAAIVVEVPAEQTLIGALTLDVKGCQVDLLGRPRLTEEGHAYELHLLITGHTPAARAGMEARLGEVYTSFTTVRENPWEVRCVVPVENIRSPGLRFIAGLFALAPMPWLVFRQGIAHARLVSPHDPEEVVRLLHDRLTSAHAVTEPRVELDWIDHFRKRIGQAAWEVPGFLAGQPS